MNSMIISLIKRIPLIEQIAAGLVIGIYYRCILPFGCTDILHFR